MKDMIKMTIEVDRRQEYKGSETIYSDLRVWLRMDAGEDAPGMRWISFLMINDEGIDLFAGRASNLSDGYHHLEPHGELWTFADLDRLYHGEEAGIAQVLYRRVCVPVDCQRMMLTDIEQAIEKYDAQGDKRESIRLDYTDRLQEWGEYYGQGKGKLVVDGPEEEIEAFKGEATFDRSWETISRLALNTTHSKGDEGLIRIYRESPTAFMWSAGRMNGGLINHGGEGAPEWSVHT